MDSSSSSALPSTQLSSSDVFSGSVLGVLLLLGPRDFILGLHPSLYVRSKFPLSVKGLSLGV